MAELEAKSSDSEDNETVTVRSFGSEENMGKSHDENHSADSTDVAHRFTK